MNAVHFTPDVAVGHVSDIPTEGARIVRVGDVEIGLFRTADGQLFAIDNRCPHRGGPLSEGIVHGTHVTCPLHNWVFSLKTGKAEGPDEGCVKTLPVHVEDDGTVLLDLSDLAGFSTGA